MNYFLVKADPDTDYSIQDLKRDGETIWDGVHNYQAINFIKTMRPGDKVLVYHSQKQKAVVGLAEVSSQPFENKDDPRHSWAAMIKFVRIFDKPITLADIKAEPSLADLKLVRNGRLSVMAIPPVMVPWFASKLDLS